MSKELIERLMNFEGSDDLGNGDFSVCQQAADTIASQAAEIELLTAELEGEKGAAANYRADAIAAGKKCGELLAALEDIAWSRPIGQKPNKYVELLERKALDAITSAKGQP